MTEPDSPSSYRGLAGAENEQASFLGGAVVQLIDGDPSSPRAVVVEVHPATVVLTSSRVVAVDGDLEWSWMLEDLEAVHHGVDQPWTILVVPGVDDHGVAVRDADVVEFRRRLGHQPEPSTAVPVVSPVLPPEPDPVIDLTSTSPDANVPRPTVGPPPPPSPAPQVEAEAHDEKRPAVPIVAAAASAPAIVALAELKPESNGAHTLLPPPPGASGTIVEGPATVIDLDPIEGDQPAEEGELGLPKKAAKVGLMARARMGRQHKAGSVALHEHQELIGLQAHEISAWFGTHHVLDRISLDMPPGLVTALIGPSGCGKSTFLRILNRMHEMIPSASLAGEVLLDGSDIYDVNKKLTDARRQIGMVFQKPNPFPAMSIYDNVVASFQLTGRKVGADDKDEVVETCLSKAGLWNEVRDRLRQPGGGLSGGQQQRLCIARALAIRPRVLLMDEPCSALDPTSTRRIEQTIMELADEVTIVIVTHNMQQAARVSHQCAFFLAEQGTPGVIVEHGETEAMFHSPQDPRTFDYVNGRFG